MRTFPFRARAHASGGILTATTDQRSLLLLASSREEPRARRLAAKLDAAWRVLRPGAASDAAELRAMAEASDLVLHLDTSAASVLHDTKTTEVYAPSGSACDAAPDPPGFRALFEAERSLATRVRLTVTPDRAGYECIHLVYGVPAHRLRFIPEQMLGELLPLALTPAPAEAASAPILLACNDYPVDETPGGGSVRVRDALRAFGQPTVLLTLASRGGVTWLAPGLVQLAVPKTAAQRAEEAEARTFMRYGLQDVLSAAHALHNEALTAAVTAMAPRVGCAVFCHCYLAPLIEPLHAVAPEVPVVYDSHNVEATLKAALLAGHPAATAVAAYVAAIEQRLTAIAAVVLCCSDADAAWFAPFARQIVMLPHGMPPQPGGGMPASPPRVGFLGSAHPPNVAAARIIVDMLAPRFRDVTFDIVGSVCPMIEAAHAPNVVLHGVVSEARKRALVSRWYVALNPVALGGGACVKLADYLAHGVPSLNTPHGARGYPIAASGAGCIAELADFPATLAALFDDPERRQAMARAAEALGRERSWSIVAAPARQVIAALMAPRVATSADAPGRRAPTRTTPDSAPILARADVLANWAATLPTDCLPLFLGGAYRQGAVRAERLHLILPGTARTIRLGLRAPGDVEITVYDVSNHSAILDRRAVNPSDTEPVEIALSVPAAAFLVELAAQPPCGMELYAATIIPHGRQDANAEPNPDLDLAACHRTGLAADSLQPERCPPPAAEWTAAQAQWLAGTLAASGRAYDRALALRALSATAGFVVVLADPARPLARARARALAHAYGTDVALADAATTWLVPRRGPCWSVPVGVAQLLVAAGSRCRALILPTPDAVGDDNATLAQALRIPVIGSGRGAEAQTRWIGTDGVTSERFDITLKRALHMTQN